MFWIFKYNRACYSCCGGIWPSKYQIWQQVHIGSCLILSQIYHLYSGHYLSALTGSNSPDSQIKIFHITNCPILLKWRCQRLNPETSSSQTDAVTTEPQVLSRGLNLCSITKSHWVAFFSKSVFFIIPCFTG